jgi:hypothetical protein
LLKTNRTAQIRIGRTTRSLGTIFEVDFGEFFVGGRPYRSEGITICCGHKYQGVDFSKAIRLYGFGTFF